MLNIRILTLSSLKRKDLEKAIKSLEKFNYEDNVSPQKIGEKNYPGSHD